jgi:hypothetical protein
MSDNFRQTIETAVYSDAERNAMRAYLQRSEVRISTMHRIATAFVGGAGLLLLIPIFFKDVIGGIMEALLSSMALHFTQFQLPVSVGLTVVLYLFILYPMILSQFLPIYSLYLLLKDIVHFYFSIYSPGFPSSLLHPTFSLGGISFSKDESPNAKRAVMQYEYENNFDFMLPFSEGKRELYFDQLIESTHGDIIPASRKWEKLQKEGVVPPDAKRKDIERFDAALGVVRSLDRNLVEEVATTEMLLARNTIFLRRMVLRYTKSLLMFLWTTLVSFVMLPFMRDGRIPIIVVMGIGYLVWSLFVIQIIRIPVTWIYRHRQEQIDYSQVDKQLTILEDRVLFFCQISLPISAMGLLMALFVWFNGM